VLERPGRALDRGECRAGFVGAFLAVPVAASLEIVLSRLQARDQPVAQDPAAIESRDESEEPYGRTLPDSSSPKLRAK